MCFRGNVLLLARIALIIHYPLAPGVAAYGVEESIVAGSSIVLAATAVAFGISGAFLLASTSYFFFGAAFGLAPIIHLLVGNAA